MSPVKYDFLYDNEMRKAKKQVHARVMLNLQNPKNENRKLAAAEHGALFDPLHVQNRYRHELIIVEKEYHSRAILSLRALESCLRKIAIKSRRTHGSKLRSAFSAPLEVYFLLLSSSFKLLLSM